MEALLSRTVELSTAAIKSDLKSDYGLKEAEAAALANHMNEIFLMSLKQASEEQRDD